MSKDTRYLGNPDLKRSHIPLVWSAETIEEYVRCKENPEYFAEKYIKIVHVDHGFIPIELYDYQKEIIEKFNNNMRTAVVTSRQAGKTTTAVCIILHYILFNEHKLVALLANKGDAAREILDRIQLAYRALPDWLQVGIKIWNKGSIELENGCKVLAAATSSSAIRGKSVALLYIDEVAFVENWDDFSASVLPTISSGKKTKILYTSTPRGLNHFYVTCEGARKGINGYAFVEVMWDRVPDRDEEWKKRTLADLNYDTERFAQEYECSFIGSSGTLISGAMLKLLSPEIPIQEKDGLRMYVQPQDKHNYVITVDVSRGKGLDYSAFQVIDVTEMPYKQVCTYKNNLVTPMDYTSVIFRIAKFYKDAIVLVETNDIGEQVSTSLLWDYEYDNLVYTESAGARGKRISVGGSKAEPGVRTTVNVKAIGCSMLKLLIEQKQLLIGDANTIYELSRFSKKGKSYEAESGAHDDLVMGLVLFAWMTDQQYFKEMTNLDTLSKLRDRTEEEIEESLMPFGFSSEEFEHEISEVIDLTLTPSREFQYF
jgi:hypothetical protein